MHGSLDSASRVQTSNGISIGSVVSAQLTVMSNRQTVTDHGISVINNRQRLHSDADRCNKKRPNQEVVRFTFVGIVDAVVDGVINARSRDAVPIRASIFRTHVTTLYYLATCTPTTHCRRTASGRLKTQVRICNGGKRKYSKLKSILKSLRFSSLAFSVDPLSVGLDQFTCTVPDRCYTQEIGLMLESCAEGPGFKNRRRDGV